MVLFPETIKNIPIQHRYFIRRTKKLFYSLRKDGPYSYYKVLSGDDTTYKLYLKHNFRKTTYLEWSKKVYETSRTSQKNT